MSQLQTQAEAIMHQDPSVAMTFTLTGLSQFLPSNTGFFIAFLDDPDKRPHKLPIDHGRRTGRWGT